MEQTLIRFYNAFFVKYDKEFMYYQSKSIDDILTHRKTRITLFYRDCMLYADDLDYNKKYYLANEIVPRIIKLTSTSRRSLVRLLRKEDGTPDPQPDYLRKCSRHRQTQEEARGAVPNGEI